MYDKLKDTQVRNSKVGRLSDGAGLFLQTTVGADGKTKNRSWLFRYVSPTTGKERAIGLGTIRDTPLLDARDARAKFRKMVRDGVDPLEAKGRAVIAAKVETAKIVTYDEAALEFIAGKKGEWKDLGRARRARHVNYAAPVIGNLPVSAIDSGLVLKVIAPIWATSNPTAKACRIDMEAVLDFAEFRGWRSGKNPARWKGNLINAGLASSAKVAPTKHHAAIPHAGLPALVGALLGDGGVDCTALAFTALCAVRSNEGRGARWSEIDIDAAAWTLPASRMKAGREHRVPLSVPALDILARIERKGSLVFNSTHHGKQISDTQFGRIMEKYAPGMKPHGLRSSFADWARENGYPADIIEHCLAHQVGTATSRSYARSDLLEQRRELMEAYGKFATGSRL